MSGCNPFAFHAGDCVLGITDGLVGFFAAVVFGLPIWLIVAIAIVGLGVAYRFGGWPAVGAALFGYGVLWGKQLSRHGDEPVETELDPRDRVSPFRPRIKRAAKRTPPRDDGPPQSLSS